MANVGTLSIKFTGDARELEKTFTKIGVKANLAASAIEGAFKLAVKVGADFIQSSVQIAAKNEATLTSFQNLTGSIGAAKDLYQDLIQFSSTTPFSFDQVSQGAQTLLGFGLNAEEATDALKDLGAAAASNADTDLKRLVVSFGQIQGANVAMTRDLREFVNNGIPIYDLLSDTLGVTTTEINRMASAGEITGDVITRVFREAADEGGRFENTLITQSKTLTGLTSTMKDNFAITLGQIGKTLLPAAKEAAIGFNDILIDLQDYFQSEDGEEWATSLAATVRATFQTAGNTIETFLAKIDLGLARLTIGTRETYEENVRIAKEKLAELEGEAVTFGAAYQAAIEDIEFDQMLKQLDDMVQILENPISGGKSGGGVLEDERQKAFNLNRELYLTQEALDATVRSFKEAEAQLTPIDITSGSVISDTQFRKKFEQPPPIQTTDSLSPVDEFLKDPGPKLTAFEQLGQIGLQLEETFTNAFAAIGEGLINIVTGTKSIGDAWKTVGAALKGIFKQLLAEITKMLAKTLAFTLLANIFSGGGFSLAGFGKNFGKLFGLPSFHEGGRMPHDGLAYLHEGEIITNPKLGQRTPGSSTTVYVRGVEYGADTYWKNANANVLGTLINGL